MAGDASRIHVVEAPTTGLQLPLPAPSLGAGDYVVFDLETTGLRPASDHVIEIGWCVVRAGAVAPVRSVLVRSPVPLPAAVQALTGITPELLAREAIPLAPALEQFFADCADLPLVGHNVVRFDAHFLEAACRRAGRPAPERGRYRDTAALYKAQRLAISPRSGQDHWAFAREALDKPAPGLRYALERCCSELGIPLEGISRHRAAGDVHLTQQLYARLCTLG
ncbi:MAG TPA: 3'-5' exonuclease [Dehalococcoidia bacterium]|jgi:DNA polymerase III epsilon subunit-like protein